eukprot:m.292133 g.292133  ORF g.292133 m.292133 type:complete len:1838 (-) comp17823_c0_seq1:6600-12113(-)
MASPEQQPSLVPSKEETGSRRWMGMRKKPKLPGSKNLLTTDDKSRGLLSSRRRRTSKPDKAEQAANDALRMLKSPDNGSDCTDNGSTDSGVPSTLPRGTPEPPADKREVQSAQLKIHMLSWPLDAHWSPGKPIPPDPSLEPQTWSETLYNTEQLKKMDKKELRRQDMIYELIQTERSFFRYLIVLRAIFQHHLEECLNQDELDALFSNLESVIATSAPICYALTRELHRQLGKPIMAIGGLLHDCFNRVDANIFADFCAQQSYATRTYQSLREKAPVARVLAKIYNNPVVGRLKFPDYIAKVMQRLTKYPLLIEGILKNTLKAKGSKGNPTSSSPERTELSRALPLAKGFLDKVDQRIKERQDYERMVHLQDNLDFSFVSHQKDPDLNRLQRLDLPANDNRNLIREGMLDMVTEPNAKKEVYVILFSDVLLFAKQVDGKFLLKCPGKTLKGIPNNPVLLLRDLHFRGDARQKRRLILINTKNACMYTLQAMTPSAQNSWYKDIEKYCNLSTKAAVPDDQIHLFKPAPPAKTRSDESMIGKRNKHLSALPTSVSTDNLQPTNLDTPSSPATKVAAHSRNFQRRSTRRHRQDSIPELIMDGGAALAQESETDGIVQAPSRPRNRSRYPRYRLSVRRSKRHPDQFGVGLTEVTSDVESDDETLRDGVFVANVLPESSAHLSGLAVGDVLLRADDESFMGQSPEVVIQRLNSVSYTELHIARSASATSGPTSAPASTTKGSRTLDAHPKRQSSLRRTHRASLVLDHHVLKSPSGSQASLVPRSAEGVSVAVGDWLATTGTDVDTVPSDLEEGTAAVQPVAPPTVDLVQPSSLADAEVEDTRLDNADKTTESVYDNLPTEQPLSPTTPRNQRLTSNVSIDSMPELNMSPINTSDIRILPSLLEDSPTDTDTADPKLPPAPLALSRVASHDSPHSESFDSDEPVPLSMSREDDAWTSHQRRLSQDGTSSPDDARPRNASSASHSETLYGFGSRPLSMRSEVDFTSDVLALQAESTDYDQDAAIPLVITPDPLDDGSAGVESRRRSSEPSGFSTPTSEHGIVVEPGEVVTLVVDLGAVNLRIGVAGEEQPHIQAPSLLADYIPLRESRANTPSHGHRRPSATAVFNGMSPASRTMAVSLTNAADSSVIDVSITEEDTAKQLDDMHFVRGTLPLDVLEACHPPELSGVVRLTYPLRKRNAVGMLTDWTGVDLLLATHLATLLPEGTECRVAVVDRLVGTTHRLMQQRHRLAQVLFDLAHVQVASVLFADQAYLSCLGSSRRCALIVHVGDSYTQVVPVIRSSGDSEMPEPLLSCARTSELAGDTITRLLGVALKEQQGAFKAVTNEPYGGSKTQLLLRAIKDECCWVSIDYQQDLQSCTQSTALEQIYPMPDGGEVCLDKECFTCVEPLFDADAGLEGLSNEATRHASLTSTRASAQASTHASISTDTEAMEELITKETIPQLVADCFSACPARYQDELWQNIVLSGGTTLLPQFDQRLRFELNQLEPERPAPVVVADPDRELLPWLGASILADLEQASNKFVTLAEHEERSARYSASASPARSKSQSRSSPQGLGTSPDLDGLTPLGALDTSGRFFRHSVGSDSTLVGSPNISRGGSTRRPVRLPSVSVEDEPYNLDLADLPASGTTMSSLSALSRIDKIRSALGNVEDQIAHLHAARQELESELSVLGDASILNVSDVFEEDVLGQLNLNPQLEEHDTEASSPATPTPMSRAKSSESLVPSSPIPVVEEPPSRPRSALTQPFDSSLTLDDVVGWDSLTVASWFETVELEGMANRAFQHGIHGVDLLDLDDDDLVSMNVLDVDLRIRVLKELELLLLDCQPNDS